MLVGSFYSLLLPSLEVNERRQKKSLKGFTGKIYWLCPDLYSTEQYPGSSHWASANYRGGNLNRNEAQAT